MSGVERRGTAWWEQQIPSLREDLLRHVRTRLPGLSDLHADLVQETLLGLTQELRRRPDSYPASWRRNPSGPPEPDRGHFRALAITILRRRIADRFDAQTREWSSRVLRGEDEPAHDRPEQRHVVKQLYAVLLEALRTESEEDRSLLIRAELEPGDHPPLSAAERQRLHRLRQRLDATVRARFGAGVGELLTSGREE